MAESIQDSWSDWLDFNQETISTVPESSGVFMMHAAMKILLIDDAENLRMKLSDSHSTPCVSDATRFRYMKHSSPKKIKDDLIKDYKERHEGNLPLCMQKNL